MSDQPSQLRQAVALMAQAEVILQQYERREVDYPAAFQSELAKAIEAMRPGMLKPMQDEIDRLVHEALQLKLDLDAKQMLVERLEARLSANDMGTSLCMHCNKPGVMHKCHDGLTSGFFEPERE